MPQDFLKLLPAQNKDRLHRASWTISDTVRLPNWRAVFKFIVIRSANGLTAHRHWTSLRAKGKSASSRLNMKVPWLNIASKIQTTGRFASLWLCNQDSRWQGAEQLPLFWKNMARLKKPRRVPKLNGEFVFPNAEKHWHEWWNCLFILQRATNKE